jgi:hypothetical protein
VRETLGDLGGAVADWTQVLEAVPDSAIVRLERGRILRILGDTVAGTEELRRAASLFQDRQDFDHEREVWDLLGLGDEWQ